MEQSTIEVISRAIITDSTETKILFCAPKNLNYFYLPGGHVEFGESAKAALARELLEETGTDANGAEFHFVGTEENIFTQEGVPRHEVNLYFEVRGVFSDGNEVLSPEEHISFHWLALADISNRRVLPERTKDFLFEWKPGKQFLAL